MKASFAREVWRGKDLYRIVMNEACAAHELRGRVLDVGSGTKAASYHRFFRRAAGAEVRALDSAFRGEDGGIALNLETDALPYEAGSVDTVLAFNILEHLYRYDVLLGEVKRVLKSGGRLIGATPFLVGYHADPHDYWRYTSEALRRMFSSHGFTDIEVGVLGYGPFSAAFAQAEILFPRVFKLLLLPFAVACDSLILRFKPRMNRERFALGLFFSCRK